MENKRVAFVNDNPKAGFWSKLDTDKIMRHKNTLKLISTKPIMKIKDGSIEELYFFTNQFNLQNGKFLNEKKNEKKQNLENKTNFRVNSEKESIKSPFKSPITSNVVNLKIKKSIIDPVYKNLDNCIVNNASELESVFLDDCNKYKRQSSVEAENKIKKIMIKDLEASKNECFVKSAFESMFCGIPKSKKTSVKVQSSSSITDIFNDKISSIVEHAKVLQDKTNSPRKINFCEKVKDEAEILKPVFFFNDDPSIDNNIENMIIPEDYKNEIHITEYLPNKNYYKRKEVNTKLNEGYKTIEIKKKAVLEVFNCPKSFFRKSGRERQVYFSKEPTNTPHNSNEILNPIILETKSVDQESIFEWEGEKQVVEIIRRIDLGSEISQDDFIYRRIDKQIES